MTVKVKRNLMVLKEIAGKAAKRLENASGDIGANKSIFSMQTTAKDGFYDYDVDVFFNTRYREDIKYFFDTYRLQQELGRAMLKDVKAVVSDRFGKEEADDIRLKYLVRPRSNFAYSYSFSYVDFERSRIAAEDLFTRKDKKLSLAQGMADLVEDGASYLDTLIDSVGKQAGFSFSKVFYYDTSTLSYQFTALDDDGKHAKRINKTAMSNLEKTCNSVFKGKKVKVVWEKDSGKLYYYAKVGF